MGSRWMIATAHGSANQGAWRACLDLVFSRMPERIDKSQARQCCNHSASSSGASLSVDADAACTGGPLLAGSGHRQATRRAWPA